MNVKDQIAMWNSKSGQSSNTGSFQPKYSSTFVPKTTSSNNQYPHNPQSHVAPVITKHQPLIQDTIVTPSKLKNSSLFAQKNEHSKLETVEFKKKQPNTGAPTQSLIPPAATLKQTTSSSEQNLQRSVEDKVLKPSEAKKKFESMFVPKTPYQNSVTEKPHHFVVASSEHDKSHPPEHTVETVNVVSVKKAAQNLNSFYQQKKEQSSVHAAENHEKSHVDTSNHNKQKPHHQQGQQHSQSHSTHLQPQQQIQKQKPIVDHSSHSSHQPHAQQKSEPISAPNQSVPESNSISQNVDLITRLKNKNKKKKKMESFDSDDDN